MRAKMPYFLHIALKYLFQVSPHNLKHKFNDYASNISRTEINVDLLHRYKENTYTEKTPGQIFPGHLFSV